jgi:hypothetical protein
MRARLEPKVAKTRVQYAKALEKSLESSARAVRRALASRTAAEGRGARTCVAPIPGAASLWFSRSLYAKQPLDAWNFVGKAPKLEPDDSRHVARLVQLASEMLSRAELGEFLETTRVALRPETATADVWLFLALSSLEFLPRRERNCLRRDYSPVVGSGREVSVHACPMSAWRVVQGPCHLCVSIPREGCFFCTGIRFLLDVATS